MSQLINHVRRIRQFAGIGMIVTAVTSLAPAPNAAYAYSAVSLSVAELADLTRCMVTGVVESQSARKQGPGVFSDYRMGSISVDGDCGATGSSFTFSMYGGQIAGGDGITIAGIRNPVAGDTLTLLLDRKSGADTNAQMWLPVEGPQGVLRIAPTSGARHIVEDAMGKSIGTVGSSGKAPSSLADFQKRDVSAVERRIRATESRKASGAWQFNPDVSLSEFHSALRAVIRQTTSVSRSTSQASLTRRLHPEKTGPLAELPATAPDFSQTTPQKVEIDCKSAPVTPPVSGGAACDGTRRPDAGSGAASGAKYVLLDNGDKLWNPYPASFGSLYGVDTGLMAEWNKYADHFRYGAATGAYGKNGRNDMGGFPTSAALNSMYGYSWETSTLGVAINGTWCLEYTYEYFLGILINTYCSLYSHESDVFLNPAKSFTLDDRAVRHGISYDESIREVLLHELGHAFGLAHSPDASIMQPIITQKGAQPWPDDVAGARAKWPSQARYEKNVGIRMVEVYGTGSSKSLFNAYAYQVGSSIRIDSFALNNFNNAAESNFEIEWYLTDAPGTFAGTYVFMSKTTVPSVAPGLNNYINTMLPIPLGYTGTWYVTAYLRSAGNSGSTIDGVSNSINIQHVDDYGNVIATAYAAPVNGSMSGVIGAAGDEDWFRFVTPSTGRLTLSSSGTTDTVGTLYSSDGVTELAFSDDNPAPNFGISRLLPTGTYYLQVKHYSPTGIGTYGVTATFAPQGCVLGWTSAPLAATVDGLVIIKLMLGVPAASLNMTAEQIDLVNAMIADRHWDFDGNGSVTAATDGTILLRAMLGFSGTAVTQGLNLGSAPRAAWMAAATPTAANSIRLYLNERCGTNFTQ